MSIDKEDSKREYINRELESFFFFFGCPAAYGVPWPQIRCKQSPLQPQHNLSCSCSCISARSFNHSAQLGSNLHPSAEESLKNLMRQNSFFFLSFFFFLRNPSRGVPVMAQRLTNPTRNHEVAGSIPGLTQWVKDLALP